MIKISRINEFKVGQNIYGFYQSTFKEKKISKNGDYYIDLFLRDRTGQINAKIWEFCNFYDSNFEEGDLVAVKGIVKNYRKKLFLEINNISLLDLSRYKKYGFNEDDIFPSISTSRNIIFNKILKDINNLNSPYKDFLYSIYNQYQKELTNYPDDLSLEAYSKKGSLVLKIYNALMIVKAIYRNKTLNDKDLILSGVLLKYIGRVKQYQYNVVFSFSDIGKSENCFILSRDIIKYFANKNKNLSKPIIKNLIDIVLYSSHDNHQKLLKNQQAVIVDTIFKLEQSLSLNQME